MEEEKKDVAPQATEEVDPNTTEESTPADANLEKNGEEAEESVEDLRTRLAAAEAAKAKSDEIANNQRIRAEKAEKNSKKAPEQAKAQQDISTKDAMALIRANVPDEDVDEVVEYAKFKKITVAEALKTSTIKNVLSERQEFRKSAEVANTGPSRKGAQTVSGESLLESAKKGNLPDSDADISKLIKAKAESTRK